jgi:hypothetical protein
MIVFKFLNKKSKNPKEYGRVVENLLNFLSRKRDTETRSIRDSSSIEIISGNLDTNTVDDEIVVEMTVKKVVKINGDLLSSKSHLDKFVREIQHFCDQASEIEGMRYVPINYRD